MPALFDVNVLVNAHRRDNREYRFYHDWLREFLDSDVEFFYSEFVLSGFVRVVTNPRIYNVPTALDVALQATETIRSHRKGTRVSPGSRHWTIFRDLAVRTKASGNTMPDTYFAALAIESGAEWITSNQGFRVFEPDLRWRLLRPSN